MPAITPQAPPGPGAVDPADHIGLAWMVAARCARMTKRHAPEELVSDAYRAIHRCAQLFDPSRGMRFSTYAVKAAVRLVLRENSLKRVQIDGVHRFVTDADAPRETWKREARDPAPLERGDLAVDQARLEMVASMLETYPDRRWATVYLARLCGASHSELARVMGVSTQAVQSRCARITRDLQAQAAASEEAAR